MDHIRTIYGSNMMNQNTSSGRRGAVYRELYIEIYGILYRFLAPVLALIRPILALAGHFQPEKRIRNAEIFKINPFEPILTNFRPLTAQKTFFYILCNI